MSWRALIFACIAMASGAFAQTPPLGAEELLHSARVWEARDRGDLARLALEKLVAARPDSPAALVELGELNLRMADIPAAQAAQQRLDSRFPNSPEARAFAEQLRFATRDRLQIASVQRLLQINRGAEARAELSKLFPQGAPDGMLGIEYFRMLARTPGGWERALDGLRRLSARHADDPRYQLALAQHMLGREATEVEGARMLNALAQREDIRTRDVDEPLGRAIRSLGFQRAPSEVLRGYAARHPDDAEIAQVLAQRIQLERELALLQRDAASALDPERQRRNLVEMQQALFAMQGATIDADRAIALVRRLRDADERARFDNATETALAWARRSRESGRRNSALADIEKEVVIAFSRNRHEDAIALAQRLDQLGLSTDADRLLADAARLDARSTWLFETRVRRLISQNRMDDALELLDTRATDGRWTVAARDELIASALDQRAQAALAAGDDTRARADLERAIQLAPAYPWTRYRLAGLLARDGQRDAGVALMREGAERAPTNPEMRYAQALLLSSVEDTDGALASLDAIASTAKTAGHRDLENRLRIDRARTQARRLAATGDVSAARSTLSGVTALADGNLDATRQLAAAWIDLGDVSQGLALFDPFLRGPQSEDTSVLLAWSDALNRAGDDRLHSVLERLQSRDSLTADERQQVANLRRERELRSIRALQREGRYAQAIEELEALLARSPNDRSLRILRAELDLSAGRPAAARDRYAALVGERPDDLDTRLDYARALTETGDVELAQLQVLTVMEQAPADAVELRVSLARRQLALDDPDGARRTLTPLLASEPTRTDVIMLAGRAELAQRDYGRARELFAQAERSSDLGLGSEARLARESIETRLNSWLEAGIESRHKPGDSGVSQFDSRLVPMLWRYARDFEHRFTLRTDAVSVDAGRLEQDFDTAALLGTIQAAGATAARPYRNERQDGLSLGIGYDTDTLSVDLGTTPLGFLLPNLVGGVEWLTDWNAIDIAIGLERRAVTSSVLSYAGMRDPVSGREWGGVVETGPYVEAGIYRENYSIAGGARYTQLTGKNVPDNTFAGLRAAADWKVWSFLQTRAYVGLTVNLWSYADNLQHYTFGHGGYYSPEQYLSIALPIEIQGTWRDWSYRVRASLSYSTSDIARAAFYPNDLALQAAAATSPLPSGYDAPYYGDEGGDGTSLSGYAAVERKLSRSLVVGAKLDIDRADFYEPTILMLYVRHVFGRADTTLAVPPRPVRAYNN